MVLAKDNSSCPCAVPREFFSPANGVYLFSFIWYIRARERFITSYEGLVRFQTKLASRENFLWFHRWMFRVKIHFFAKFFSSFENWGRSPRWPQFIFPCRGKRAGVSNVISPIIAILSDKDEQSFVRSFVVSNWQLIYFNEMSYTRNTVLYYSLVKRFGHFFFFFNSYHPRMELSFSCKLFIKILDTRKIFQI